MLKKILKKKILIFFLIIIILGGYFGYKNLVKKENETNYITASVEKGTLIVSVSGSGQVTVLDQIAIKPKVSGEIMALYADKDQKVRAGQLLAKLDSKEAEQKISDAESALETAILGLKRLEVSKKDAEINLVKSYDNGFNLVTDVFISLPEAMDKLEKMFLESSYGGDEADIDYYKSLVVFYTNQTQPNQEYENYYLELEKKYKSFWQVYQSVTRLSSPEKIEDLLRETLSLTQEISDLTRSARDIVVSYQKILKEQSLVPPISISVTKDQLSELTDIFNSFNQKVSNLSSATETIKNRREAIGDYDDDIQSQETAIKQKENTLLDAKEKLSNYSIQVPFSGIIAEVNVRKGDSISTATTLATLITKQKIAEISLNEVDAAKVKVGQKTTLTFDALPDLSISGKVTEVDTIGQVSQGVVSYSAKIAFDTDIEEIKPGMSVTADIITEAKQNVILVPNSALKSQQNVYYVQVIENNNPRSRQVEVGLSGDLYTEIVSGLEEGDIIVTSTISPNTTQTTRTQTNQNQQFQIPGMDGPMRIR